ncbi:hypothetical protein FDJ47_gp33 [Enterobacter phage Ec_L1]|uniref:Uncharacterized protein n=1 Tax=Enterobacter phage Ec_L1 TaxID=2070180 RepID=A0A2P0W9W8_9CAUD|nr:hypothetical protein FDJ47_gp33 [Enterobacter phage Ec_L1]AUV57147.1 hypothetical protein Ec33 [Enterobacter phage Ec_L1]
MVTIQGAIDFATDNGVVVGATFTEGMLERKYFRVKRGDKQLKVEHCGGKKWRIVKAGFKPQTQAHCIVDAVTELLDGDPVQ